MARKSTPKKSSGRPEGGQSAGARTDSTSDPDAEARGGAIPEFIRRTMALGLTGFFSTEEAVRKALGDTLPKDWLDFASLQSERTRAELMDRLAAEFGKVLSSVDLGNLAEQLFEGRTLEIRAQIRLGERAQASDGSEESESWIDLAMGPRKEGGG